MIIKWQKGKNGVWSVALLFDDGVDFCYFYGNGRRYFKQFIYPSDDNIITGDSWAVF